MRPKARVLALTRQGWLDEVDPSGIILYLMDGLHSQPFSVPYS